MRDNIETKNIGNRKFILELRYDPVLSMLDKRGEIVESIINEKMFSTWQWEISQGEVRLRDHTDKEKARNFLSVSFNRINLMSYQIDSVESFYSKFEHIRSVVYHVIGTPTITRIGCRIIGTYNVKSTDYQGILKGFTGLFPSTFLIEPYVTRDFLFHMEYDNGMYEIGPLNNDDQYYDREFKFDGCVKHVGIVIDTDNYLTNESKNISNDALIKDVYTLSLSVEKDLFSHLMNL